MFGMPATSEFDLRFRLLGIPVRVTPWFWIVSAIMASQTRSVRGILVWVACVFVSILVHEFGHGLMARAFGDSPWIILHGLGGSCYSDPDRRPWQRLLILFGGPGAGFLFCAAIFAGYLALGQPQLSAAGGQAFGDLIFINLVWGLVNLLPVWFLDGGRIVEVLLNLISRRNGTRWTHIVSLLSSSILAMVAFTYTRDLFLTIFFAYFALINFQALQSLHQQYAVFGEDNADWWKR